MKIKDKTIVVTGAGGGIGRELVLQLLGRGANVVAIDVNQVALDETYSLARSYTKTLFTIVADVMNQAKVARLPEIVIEQMGTVDGLINNAGIMHAFKTFNDIDLDSIERVLKVNLFGTIYMTKAFLPRLLERPSAHIVNLSSMAGFLPVAGQSIYCASKGAIKQLTEVLHEELSDSGVGVTVVYPGAVDTSITKNAGVVIPQKMIDDNKSYKQLLPARAAHLIIEGIEKNKRRLVLGMDAKLMDKYYRLSPSSATNFIYKKMKSLLIS